MNPNNLFTGYSYKEKIRFMEFREMLQEEERLDRFFQDEKECVYHPRTRN